MNKPFRCLPSASLGKKGKRGARHTVTKPFTELARLGGLDVTLLEVVEEVGDDLIHVRLHGQHTRNRVVADHRAFKAGVFDIITLAEHMVGDFAIDERGTVLVKVGL